jgi:conjugal transfer/entry exclusion protein
VDARFAKEKRDRWRKDAQDGRVLLRAADHVLFRMDKASKALESEARPLQSGCGKVMPPPPTEDNAAPPVQELGPTNESTSTSTADDTTGPTVDDMRLRKEVEQSRADAQKAAKPRRGSMEPDKP